jgi:hypothetical protein
MKKLRANEGRLVEVRLLETRPRKVRPAEVRLLRSGLIEGFDCPH